MWRAERNGIRCPPRPDGWRRAAAVGPAHGADRHPARLRLRPAPGAVEGAGQPLRGVCRRARADDAAAEQHGDRAHDRLVHGARGRRPRLGPGDPARRERGHHADRAAALVQRRRRRAGPVHRRRGRVPQRLAQPGQGPRPRLHRPGAGAAGAAHPARHAAAGRERARRARAAGRHHGRSGDVHPARRSAHVGGALERRHRAADHVAGLFVVRHPGGGAGAGAGRQPRQRHQPGVRGRPPRRCRELSPPRRQPAQQAGRRRARRPVPAPHRRGHARLPARHGAHDGRVPHGLQRGCWQSSSSACSARSPGCWRSCSRRARTPPTPPRRATSTRPRSTRPRWHWPTPPARRCAWAMSSRSCCGRSCGR